MRPGCLALVVTLAAASAGLGAAPAGADTPDSPVAASPTPLPPADEPVTPVGDPPPLEVTTWSPGGLSFAIGGGVGGFTDAALRDRADGSGAGYEIRGVFGTRTYASIEVAHFGLVQSFELDTPDELRLLATGGEMAVRFNVLARRTLQPYVLGGVGWTHVNLLGQAGERAGEDDRKNLFHVPVGAGVSIYFGNFVLDVRGQARLTPEKEDRLFADIDEARLTTWAASAQIGWHLF